MAITVKMLLPIPGVAAVSYAHPEHRKRYPSPRADPRDSIGPARAIS